MIRRTCCGPRPFVTCVLATKNRPGFVEMTVAQFLAQDWPADRRELLILDDSDEGLKPAVAADGRLVRMPAIAPMGLGEKRNAALALARGDVIHHWDDDDWSGPGRIAAVTVPIWLGRADVTMFRYGTSIAIPSGRFFELRGPWAGRVNDGTWTARRSVYDGSDALRYSPGTFETLALRTFAETSGMRLVGVDPGRAFVYTRLPSRTWEDPGWARKPVSRPSWFPEADVEAMRAAWDRQLAACPQGAA
jgi:glycosyltransferase involved in cell wall biosynthesis